MKFGQSCHGPIASMDEKGRGVMQGPRPLVVPFTVTGDEVEATCVRREHQILVCRLETVRQPSPVRVKPPCPHAGTCGGCLWQHIAYEEQLRLKTEMVCRALAAENHDERIESVVPAHDQFRYRNRMDYVIGWGNEIGLKAYGAWNRYCDLTDCLLLDEQTPFILDAVRNLMRDFSLKPWDAKFHRGQLRYCVIRRGIHTGERLIVLVVKDRAAISDACKQAMQERLSPLCTSLLLGENPDITDLSICQTHETLFGNPFLTEQVNGIHYRIHPNAFFQTNTRMAAELQTRVLAQLGPLDGQRVLDLYCGLGFFSIACAKAGATVYGHEIDAHAIACAQENATINGVTERMRFGIGPVENLAWEKKRPQAVIIDPPRAGMHPRALRTILANRPQTIIYVSCNYRAFAKELTVLKTAYRVASLCALDLFPQTPHVELVTRLVRCEDPRLRL